MSDGFIKQRTCTDCGAGFNYPDPDVRDHEGLIQLEDTHVKVIIKRASIGENDICPVCAIKRAKRLIEAQ